jgi:hypothetical protein
MPPSNTSSPLSDAASLPNTGNDDVEDDIPLYEPRPSRQLSPDHRRRDSRSATSSTVQIRQSRDDDSDLSDLSDEEEQEQQELENDSDGDEEDVDVEEQEPKLEVLRPRLLSAGYRNPAGGAAKASPGQRYVGSLIPYIQRLTCSGNLVRTRQPTKVTPIRIPFHPLHPRQDLKHKIYPKLIPHHKALY